MFLSNSETKGQQISNWKFLNGQFNFFLSHQNGKAGEFCGRFDVRCSQVCALHVLSQKK